MLKLQRFVDASEMRNAYLQQYSKKEKVQVVYQEADTTHGQFTHTNETGQVRKDAIPSKEEVSDSEDEICVDDDIGDDLLPSETHVHDNADISREQDHKHSLSEHSKIHTNTTKSTIVVDDDDCKDRLERTKKEDPVKIGSERSAFSRPDMPHVRSHANGSLAFTSEGLTPANLDLPRGLINMDLVTNPMLRAMEGHALNPHHRMQAASYWLHMTRLHQASQVLYPGLLAHSPLIHLPPTGLGFPLPPPITPHQHLISQAPHFSPKPATISSPEATSNPSDSNPQPTSPTSPEDAQAKGSASQSPSSDISSPRSHLNSSSNSSSSGTEQNSETLHPHEIPLAHLGHSPMLSLNPHPGFLHPSLPGYGVRRPRDPTKPPPLKKYKCDLCGKAFSRSNTLVTHRRIHTGEKPFACDTCGRAFRQPGNLTRHRLTHTSHKPYVCPVCKKAFNRTSNLQTHMRTHSNVRPFVCTCCNKSFQQRVDLKVHMYSHASHQHGAPPHPEMTS